MRFLVPLVLAVSLLLLPVSGVPATEPSAIQRVVPSIVYVDVDAVNMCTGFVVAPRRVLTAVHCLPEKGEPTVDKLPTRVVKRDAWLALLEVETPKPPVTLGSLPAPGESVVALGFAYNGPLTVLSRSVALIEGGDVVMDGALAPGMSGGPVIDAAGRVVGLSQMTGTVLSMSCGSGEIKAFLK